jgi:ATP-binding cassette subfamily F protein 3
MLLRLEGISKAFGDRALFSGVDLTVSAGDRIGLVGPNGAGKTTLLGIAAGDESQDGGRRSVARGVRVGTLRQEVDPTQRHTVREEVASALRRIDDLERELRELEERMAALGREGEEIPRALAERYDRVHGSFSAEGGFQRESRIERVLAGLGFESDDRGRPLNTFSGGWLMRVELAKLLLSEPDVLLLDEPTNHLDLPSIQWFEETLAEFKGGAIVISHDRTFLRRHVQRVAELEDGRFTIYQGGYDRYLSEREARREELLARKRSQDQKIAAAERFIERFRAKASKARQVQSRVKVLEKLERVEIQPVSRRRMRLRIPAPERAGAIVVELQGVCKSYGETRVYQGIDLRIARGDRVALVGPNGAGKSTLLRILAGVLPVDAGQRIPGHRVQAAFYTQHQIEALTESRSVLEELESVAKTDDHPHLRGHLGAFLFSGEDVEKKIAVLSGGEKARLALAKMLLRPSNLLVLDEPTNHLDLEACEVLEEALRQYQGTLVLITHDRSFINALATRVVEVRSGQLREFLGNYDDYLRKAGGADRAPAERGAVPGHGRREAASAAGARSEPASTEGARSEPEASGVRQGAASEVDAPLPHKERRRLERERRKAREKAERRVQAIEAAILEKESALEALGWKLGDPEIHRDADRVRSLEGERSSLREAIEELYREWERLAAEIESLDQAPQA